MKEREGGVATSDYLINAAMERDVPGLRAALDGVAMRPLIGEALLGGADDVKACAPGQIRYLPSGGAGSACIVRYDVRAGDADWVVTGRVLPDAETALRYVSSRLEPLAARAAERHLGPFRRLAAAIEPLGVALAVFPVDADLPALIEATDPACMLDLFAAHLGERYARCGITPVAYARQGRCVLRYDLERADGRPGRTLFGKLTTGGDGIDAPEILDGLPATFDASPVRVTLPRAAGYDERLGMLLMDPVDGIREARSLLVAWGKGESGAVEPLEERLRACASIGALLHGSGISAGAARTLDDELAELGADVDGLTRIDPDTGASLAGWLDRARQAGESTREQASGLAHGDFTISQFLFDERGTVALLDFDDACQAEPALDLGQFTAYLKLGGVKRAGAAERAQPLVDVFLEAHAQASGLEREQLADRHAVHEICAFVRLAANAWHKLKRDRLANVLGALEGASAWRHRVSP
jgi:hypothetical protein